MGLKKKKSFKQVSPANGQDEYKKLSRNDAVKLCVLTDKTFTLVNEGVWCGSCIHCNSKFIVEIIDNDVQTLATLEHIKPLVAGGSAIDPKNLALACARCNSSKGIRHDKNVGKSKRSDEIIEALLQKRSLRWRDEEA